jgi:predicted nicotinamide N-methyase
MLIETNSESSLEGLRRRFDVVSANIEVAGRTFELFRPRSADDLISEEDFDRDERLPYWADVWPSSIVLAERVAAEAGGGRSLLELGCGVGLVAVVAASVGFDVTATDYYAEALEFARLNGRHNGQTIAATRLVDWRDFPADLGKFDLVIASDVLYERPSVPLVAAALAASLTPTGQALVADPQRLPAKLFPDECRRQGLDVVRTMGIPISRNGNRQSIDVFEIRPASNPFAAVSG